MGGPKDEDPPVVLEMSPLDQSLNTKPEEIIITFDEYIRLDNANKNILITPRINKDEVIFIQWTILPMFLLLPHII